MGQRIDIEALRGQLPIAEMLRRLGHDVGGAKQGRTRCPIPCCKPSRPRRPPTEFSYNETSWHCFRCGRYGDTFSLASAVLGVDFRGVLAWLKGQDVPMAFAETARAPRLSLHTFLRHRLTNILETYNGAHEHIEHDRDVALNRISVLESYGDISADKALWNRVSAERDAEQAWMYLDAWRERYEWQTRYCLDEVIYVWIVEDQATLGPVQLVQGGAKGFEPLIGGS